MMGECIIYKSIGKGTFMYASFLFEGWGIASRNVKNSVMEINSLGNVYSII